MDFRRPPPDIRFHLFPHLFGKSRITEHRFGRGRNEVVEQHMLRPHVVAVTRSCDYVPRGSNGMALVRGAARLRGCGAFIRNIACAAVAGSVASDSAPKPSVAHLSR